MKAEVCQYSKFGFCNFKEGCLKINFTEVCESLIKCKTIKESNKRHSKNCTRFLKENGYIFQKECAYRHQVNKHTKELDLFQYIGIRTSPTLAG